MSDTVFVKMYNPNLGNVQVDAPLQAVSTYQAHGWLLLDPNATPPPVASPYLSQPAADSRYLRDWAGAEVLTAGAVRVAPDGHVIVRTADGTTRSTYDTTEQALWTSVTAGVAAVAGLTGSPTAQQIVDALATALRAAYVPKWKPSTAYASGEFVLNPSGQIVSANTAFTSGASYSASNWTVVSGGSSYTDEQAQDAVAALFAAGTNTGITFVYDDAGNRISATVNDATKAPLLTPTATKTAAYTAAVGDLAMMNVAGGATVLTLPTAPADKAQVGYRAIGATTGTPLVVNRGGSTDTIGTTGATSASIPLADEVVVLQYDAPNTRWLGMSNVKTQASLDARYAAVLASNVFSPKSYGGAGDGVTDDTTAIGSAWTALKAAGGGVLDLGAFPWLVSGLELTGGSNFVVRGQGATLLARGNSTGAATRINRSVLVIADSTDFHVTGITIDGQRDTIAGSQWVQASLTAGATTVTVSDGTKYVVGERIGIFGGLTANAAVDANKKDQALTISAIAGNVLTFSPTLANSYTATPGTGGTYVTRYQQGASLTVAGRNLSGEDQQVGLHLINCQRFKVTGITARNVWQAPIRTGTGFTNATGDGCSDGTIADNVCVHGYDQGVSVWNSQRITVSGNVISDAGWGGVVLTQSDDCTVVGNTCTAMAYQIPGDTSNGNGIAIEGGARNVIVGNTCTGNNARGIEIAHNPQQWGIVIGSPPTLTGYQLRNATSLVVSSSAVFVVGGVYSIYDGAKTERITVSAIPDSTHITVSKATRWNHAGGSFISLAVPEDNIVIGNNFSGSITGDGVRFRLGVRTILSGNTIQLNSGRGITMTKQTLGSAALTATGTQISGNIIGHNETSDEQVRLDCVQDVDVVGNTITGTHKFSTAGLGIRGSTDVRVANNRISDCALQGIIVSLGILVGSQTPGRVKISGNTVERNNDIGISVTSAAAGIDISDNLVVNNNSHGISLASVSRVNVRGNTCMDNKTTGIVLASATFCVVSGNTCTDDATGINPNSGLSNPQTFGITESGTSDSNVIAQNSVYGNGTAQITVVGASTVQVNNI